MLDPAVLDGCAGWNGGGAVLAVNATSTHRTWVRAFACVVAAWVAGGCSSVVTASDASADHQDAVVDTLTDAHDGSCRLQYCLPGYECVRDYGFDDAGQPLVAVCRSLPASCVLPSLSECPQDSLGRCECPACAAPLLCPGAPCHVVPVSGPNIRVDCAP